MRQIIAQGPGAKRPLARAAGRAYTPGMRIPAPLALLALLLSGAVSAQTRVGSVDVVPSAPAPVSAAPTVTLAPSLSLGSPLAAPALGAPALAAAPQAAVPAASLPIAAAPQAVPAAAAALAAAPALSGAKLAAADGPKASPEAVEAPDLAG